MNIYEEILLNENAHVRQLLSKGPMRLSIELDKKPTDVLLRDGLHACIELWGQYLTVEVACKDVSRSDFEQWHLLIKWTPINWKASMPHWGKNGTIFLPTKLASSQCPHVNELKLLE